jgi:hypothetical protein
MADVVERLRARSEEIAHRDTGALLREAAHDIEWLREERDRLHKLCDDLEHGEGCVHPWTYDDVLDRANAAEARVEALRGLLAECGPELEDAGAQLLASRVHRALADSAANPGETNG